METANHPTLINSKTLRQKDNSLKQNGNILSLFWKILVCVFSIVFLFFIFFVFFCFFLREGGEIEGLLLESLIFFLTASQMWLLGRILPAIIGHCVP